MPTGQLVPLIPTYKAGKYSPSARRGSSWFQTPGRSSDILCDGPPAVYLMNKMSTNRHILRELIERDKNVGTPLLLYDILVAAAFTNEKSRENSRGLVHVTEKKGIQTLEGL